jgi:septal ring factor EnvC (AmiA/AmiB activator)
MRRFAPVLALPLLAAASVPVQPEAVPLDAQIKQARAEQAAAEAQAAKLEQSASKARSEAERLHAEQAAAAQAVEAAEARITAADAELRIASAFVAAHRRQLAEQQRPVASLLAGLAMMSRRPPLLAIADQRNVDELVKVRILLASTLPVIRARTAKLTAQLNEGQRLEEGAIAARAELLRSRQDLGAKRQQFAALEQKALQLAASTGGQAISVGDVALAAGENVEKLSSAAANNRSIASIASQLAAADPAPARPIGPDGPSPRPPFRYDLPAAGAVTEGLAAVNESGVRSRGLTLATYRGAPVTAPAAGTIRFSGPYQDYDGVLIIDHGGGWISLLVNVASELKAGDRVELGQPIGRALGPLQVELSQNGRRISPALIAGSSQNLSKGPKGG